MSALDRIRHLLDEWDADPLDDAVDEYGEGFCEGWNVASQAVRDAFADTVTDGHAEWAKCHRADCDLVVVRPGKVQCHGRCAT